MTKPKNEIYWNLDARRDIALPGNTTESLEFSVYEWLEKANDAIDSRGVFNCALSGGSTPKMIYSMLTEHKHSLDWSKVQLYFSDERVVPMTDKESNFHMAWEAGFKDLVEENQIHPMFEGGDPEEAALRYEDLLKGVNFDLVMLGMGDDGHTASLFPHTHALHAEERLVVANFLPEKEVWRVTFTFEAINQSKATHLYVFGANKAAKVKEVLLGSYDPDALPSQKIGTSSHKALWILDQEASSLLS